LGSYQIDTIRNMEGEIFGGNYGIIHILPNSASGVLNVGRTLPYSNRYNLQIVVIH
jgi:hypothetical protein